MLRGESEEQTNAAFARSGSRVLRMASVKQQRRMSALQAVHPLLSLAADRGSMVRRPLVSAHSLGNPPAASAAMSVCIKHLRASAQFVEIYSQPDATLGVFLASTAIMLALTAVIWLVFGSHEPLLCQLPAAICMALVTTTTVSWWLLGPPFRGMVIRHVLLLAELPCMMIMALVPCFLAPRRIPFQNVFWFTAGVLPWQLALATMITSVDNDSAPSRSALGATWKILYLAFDRGLRTMNNVTDFLFINLIVRMVRFCGI